MTPKPENEDFYIDEQGFYVFTEKALLKRGFCCGQGCRHCPYDYENVPEPRRSDLHAKRNDHDSTKKE